MTKALGLIILGLIASTIIAQGQQISEEALQTRIAGICKDYLSYYKLPDNARELALEGGLSPEWLTETLEGMIRKNMPILEQALRDEWTHPIGGPSNTYRKACDSVRCPIIMLREFYGTNTLSLIRDCAFSSGVGVVLQSSIDTYIAIAGGDAVPFLREALEKKITDGGDLSQRLERVMRRDQREGKTDDIKTFFAFLMELAQAEQEASNADMLDKTLCTLVGYEHSIQRRQNIERFANAESARIRDLFRERKAELDKLPAGKRTDLSAWSTVLPKRQEAADAGK